ncbi:hypothetical protein HOG48_03285, partial [Candidatus Peregrinibacteria bacterium]|nr:hypothetical protein [Candidatus Peregrinibacteria bacterium]
MRLQQTESQERRPVTKVEFSAKDGFDGILKKLVKIERRGERLDSSADGYTGVLAIQKIYDFIVRARAHAYKPSNELDERDELTRLADFLESLSPETLQSLVSITNGNGLATALSAAFSNMSPSEFLAQNPKQDEDDLLRTDLLAKVNEAKAKVLTKSRIKVLCGKVDEMVIPGRFDTARGVFDPGAADFGLMQEFGVLKLRSDLIEAIRIGVSDNPFERLKYRRTDSRTSEVTSTNSMGVELSDVESFAPIEFSEHASFDQIVANLFDLYKRGKRVGQDTSLAVLVKLKLAIESLQEELIRGIALESIRANLDSTWDQFEIPVDANLKAALTAVIGKMPAERIISDGLVNAIDKVRIKIMT